MICVLLLFTDNIAQGQTTLVLVSFQIAINITVLTSSFADIATACEHLCRRHRLLPFTKYRRNALPSILNWHCPTRVVTMHAAEYAKFNCRKVCAGQLFGNQPIGTCDRGDFPVVVITNQNSCIMVSVYLLILKGNQFEFGVCCFWRGESAVPGVRERLEVRIYFGTFFGCDAGLLLGVLLAWWLVPIRTGHHYQFDSAGAQTHLPFFIKPFWY